MKRGISRKLLLSATPSKDLLQNHDSDESLVKRYLFWLYKMTRDELDRVDRKFTQLEVDRGLQRIFRKYDRGPLASFVEEWDRYIVSKEADARKLKFDGAGRVLASYAFLRVKLEAIKKTAAKRFGSRLVREFEKRIEDAAIKNILQDTSGRR